MIIMIGNHICKDCAAAEEVIKREHLPIEFHDMGTELAYIKEFLKVREGNEALFAGCRENGQIGIPVFLLEDQTVTLDPEAAFEEARKAKKAGVIMYGSHLCSGCRETLQIVEEEGLTVEFHDIAKDLVDFRAFLKIREGRPDLYDKMREEGRIGIPVFVLPDGTVTTDREAALAEMRK